MLSCEEVVERASEYLDRDLGRWGRLKVRLHIAMCKHCNRYVLQLGLTTRLVRSRPADPLAPHVEDQLIESFRQAPPEA
ncbi:MAG: zf-HC2 domain-containing protein [Methylocystis sp.]|nr:zf-HC2 domain-containing protein [Methylocystis sp.]